MFGLKNGLTKGQGKGKKWKKKIVSFCLVEQGILEEKIHYIFLLQKYPIFKN